MNRKDRRAQEKQARRAGPGAARFDAHTAFNQAVGLHQAGDLDGARRLYEQILSIADSAQVECNYGAVLRSQGQPTEALAHFERALEQKDDFPEAWSGKANALRDLGAFEESIVAYGRAIELRPNFYEALANMGTLLQGMGQYTAAEEALSRAAALRPGDTNTLFQLAAIRGTTDTATPDAYTRSLFDSYADRFDTHLQEGLGYDAPSRLYGSVARDAGEDPHGWVIADVGCGTGLCGIRFRPLARRLIGIDLAPRMIDKARERGIYDELVVGEAADALRQLPASLDLVVAGDVLIYCGDGADIFAAVAAALKPGGRFAFTVEEIPGDSFALRPTARFGHSEAYLQRLAAGHGLCVSQTERFILRHEHDGPVPGLLHVMTRT